MGIERTKQEIMAAEKKASKNFGWAGAFVISFIWAGIYASSHDSALVMLISIPLLGMPTLYFLKNLLTYEDQLKELREELGGWE